MGSHKTKQQIEAEYRKLQKLYADKCAECDLAKTVSSAAKADCEETLKLLGEVRAELSTKEACNKKLADQFYDYRTELTKVRKELADTIENRDSLKIELEGVRGALKRESELRVDTEKKRDEYKQETVKLKTTAEDYQNRWHSACRENERLRNYLNEVEKIQRKHNMLTLESLDNALKQWNYIDGKLSHDLCMPLESLILMLDNYGVNDFCKLRERLMYGPTTDYSNALAKARKLEKENMDLKAVADDLEKQRKEAVQNFETASRKNDELQNEVNKLQQRWTDTFNPEDELLGRKVLEWQEINVTMAKHNIENAMVLESELDMLKEYRKVLDKHGIMGLPYLVKRISQSCPEEYMKVFNVYGIDSAETLRKKLNTLASIKGIVHAIRHNIPGFSDVINLAKELA